MLNVWKMGSLIASTTFISPKCSLWSLTTNKTQFIYKVYLRFGK
jgi:hypothetical protein